MGKDIKAPNSYFTENKTERIIVWKVFAFLCLISTLE